MLTAFAQHMIAIACGGTGGHIFPGLAVAEEMTLRNWTVTMLVSPKHVDQRAARAVGGVPNIKVVTLPAAPLQRGGAVSFLLGFISSYRLARALFRQHPPAAVLAMGGFTSAAPILAGKRVGAWTFLHESNTVPGRANRFLAKLVDEAFVGFAETAERLKCKKATVTGTPVRRQFRPLQPPECRITFGLEAARPTVLVMGGSQGSSALNRLVIGALPLLAKALPELQWIHLTGPQEADTVAAAYAQAGFKSVVQAFCEPMHLAMGAATVAVSRAGASALSELAALQLPAILVPYPAAAGNHQLYNARALEQAGAALVLEQHDATPDLLSRLLNDLIDRADAREKMRAALARLHTPHAAASIVDAIIKAVPPLNRLEGKNPRAACAPVSAHTHLSPVP